MEDVEEIVRSTDALNDLYEEIAGLFMPAGQPAIPTAVDHAYEMIWRGLVRHEHAPGQRLADTELALQFGLSRTPVRHALHRLAQEELVRFDPRHGFSVKVLTPQDVSETYDIRGALEVLALRQAAPNLSPKDLQDQLQQLHTVRVALQEEANQRSLLLHLRRDFGFHNLLIRGAGNGRLLRALAALRSQVALFQYWDTAFPTANIAAGDEHEAILLALIDGDIERAAERMEEHVRNSKDRVLADIFDVEKSAREPDVAAALRRG